MREDGCMSDWVAGGDVEPERGCGERADAQLGGVDAIGYVSAVGQAGQPVSFDRPPDRLVYLVIGVETQVGEHLDTLESCGSVLLDLA